MSEVKTSLYELNKNIMKQLQPLSEDRVEDLKSAIKKLDNGEREYFMLLSLESKDFTVFHLQGDNLFVETVMEILNERGVIKEFDSKEDTAVEIWIGDIFYALFPYDLGVIKC